MFYVFGPVVPINPGDIVIGAVNVMNIADAEINPATEDTLASFVYIDDADWTDNASKHVLVGGLYQSQQQAITDGDVGPFQVDIHGNQLVRLLGDDAQLGVVGCASDVDGNVHGQLRYIGEQLETNLGAQGGVRKFAIITCAANATADIIAAVAGKKFRILSLVFSCGTAAGSVVFKDEVANCTGVMPIAEYGGMAVSSESGLFATGTNQKKFQVTTVDCTCEGVCSYVEF